MVNPEIIIDLSDIIYFSDKKRCNHGEIFYRLVLSFWKKRLVCVVSCSNRFPSPLCFVLLMDIAFTLNIG